MSGKAMIGTAEGAGPRHLLRFVWQMDEEGRFSIGSDEFIRLMGPPTAARMGQPWRQLAAALDLDPEGQLERAIASGETWSGLTVAWPVDGHADRISVELSGLPIFDRGRIFRGYRGFGICRDLQRLDGLARCGSSASPAVVLPAAARIGGDTPYWSAEEDCSPPVPPPAGGLTPSEQTAFGELSRKLAQRLQGLETGDEPAGREPEQETGLQQGHSVAAVSGNPGGASPTAAHPDRLVIIGQELHAPLNAIVEACEMMLEERFGATAESYRACVEDIHAGARQILSLLAPLLRSFAIDASKRERTIGRVQLNALTQECAAIMQRAAAQRRVIVRSSLAPTLPPVVGSAATVREIVFNLLSGMLKLTRTGGQVIISTSCDERGQVLLRVRDSGSGIGEKNDAAARPEIATASGGATALPLRLMLSKALAEAYGATFQLIGERDGRSVKIAFPIKRV